MEIRQCWKWKWGNRGIREEMKPLLCALNMPLNPSSTTHDHYGRSWTLRITADLMKMIMAISTQKSVIHNKGPKNSFPLILLLQENTMSIKQAGWKGVIQLTCSHFCSSPKKVKTENQAELESGVRSWWEVMESYCSLNCSVCIPVEFRTTGRG